MKMSQAVIYDEAKNALPYAKSQFHTFTRCRIPAAFAFLLAHERDKLSWRATAAILMLANVPALTAGFDAYGSSRARC